MEFKGTKIKWELEYLCDENSIRASINNGSIDVWSDINGETKEEANANALLISKAPEMLEMLRSCALEFGWYKTELAQGSPLESKIVKLIKEATKL